MTITGFMLCASLAIAARPSVEATSDNGRVIRGELTALDATQAVVALPNETVRVGLDELSLLRIAAEGPKTRVPTPIAVKLHDGSTLAATRFTAAGGQAMLALACGASVAVSTGEIASVRLGDPANVEAAVSNQWNAIANATADGDRLVVRKGNALDDLTGRIGDVTEETVSFVIDGEPTPVKRAKIEGWLYYRSRRESAAERICDARLVDSSRLQLAAATLSGEAFELTTLGGATVTLAVASIESFDFAAARMQYLSDLDPQGVRVTPRLEPAEPIESLISLLQPRKDVTRDGRPLMLAGRECRGWSLASRTEMEFRLPSEFRRLRAIVAIDETVASLGGQAFVRLQADGKTIWERTVHAADPPEAIDLDISSTRRLQLVVDFGDQRDAGDWVNFYDVKVIK